MDFILEGFFKAIGLLLHGDESTWSAIFTTLKVSTGSMVLSLLAGLPVGCAVGYFNFKGKQHIRTILDTMLALPTVFIGLMVYAFISRQGPLGELGLLYTLPGISIGQAILAFPIIAAITAATIENIDPDLKLTLATLGAGKRAVMRTCLWEIRYAVMVAAVTAYGRVMTEVGISMIIGGNIKYHTRTITTAIALETNKGQFADGIALGLVLITIAFVFNLTISRLKRQ